MSNCTVWSLIHFVSVYPFCFKYVLVMFKGILKTNFLVCPDRWIQCILFITIKHRCVPTPRRPVDNNWHYNFPIPWNKMPTEVMGKLNNKEWPMKGERLQMIKSSSVKSSLSAPCQEKKHMSEVTRKMVATYPSSFQDVNRRRTCWQWLRLPHQAACQ